MLFRSVGDVYKRQAQEDDFRPFPFYQWILVPRHITWANYNALQSSWNRQKGRLNYGFNYTWSKALGVRGAYNNGGTTDATNLRADYGPLAFDRTNVFKMCIRDRVIPHPKNACKAASVDKDISSVLLCILRNKCFYLSGERQTLHSGWRWTGRGNTR